MQTRNGNFLNESEVGRVRLETHRRKRPQEGPTELKQSKQNEAKTGDGKKTAQASRGDLQNPGRELRGRRLLSKIKQ